MLVFTGNTADEVWLKAAREFRVGENTHEQLSRAGSTHEIMGAMFEIQDSRQRWTVSRRPAINPAFALAEVIWIVAGRRDAAFLNFWNPKLPEFAGHVRNYHGAYGYRLNAAHKVNQLDRAYRALLHNGESRQVVLQIWHPSLDLPKKNGTPATPDIPCNITSMLKIRNGKLEWTQILRSNDLILGVPHNFVQFTSLQEIMAAWLGVDVGVYRHYSDCLHVYSRDMRHLESLEASAVIPNSAKLQFTKKEFDALILDLCKRVEMMISPKLTQKQLKQLAYHHALSQELYDWFLILAADCARRNGWWELVEEFTSTCSNPALKHLWSGWHERSRAYRFKRGKKRMSASEPTILQGWLPLGPVPSNSLHV